MTLAEFKAWFEGFTEDMDEVPTKKQWARIKVRVKEIDGSVTTERIFIDRYFDRYWPQFPPPLRPWYGMSHTLASAQCQNANDLANQYQSAAQNFSSMNAMAALGRAEYKAEAA